MIAAELDDVYSREAIRKKLRATSLELAEGPEFTPWRSAEHDADLLNAEGVEEAEGYLAGFEAVFHTLPSDEQEALLGAARKLIGTLESGSTLEQHAESAVFPLAI